MNDPGVEPDKPLSQDKPLSVKVEALAGFGIPTDEIARVLAVDPGHLTTTYAHELETGATKANARVAESLYRQATGKGRQAVTAAIFWLKTRARWKETTIQEHAGVPERPILIVTGVERASSRITPADS